MPEVKWIRITTDMFDDEKIRLIEAMADADALINVWVKLLCHAGRVALEKLLASAGRQAPAAAR